MYICWERRKAEKAIKLQVSPDMAQVFLTLVIPVFIELCGHYIYRLECTTQSPR